MTKESEFDSWQGQKIIILSKASILTVGPTQQRVQWVLRGGGCYLRVTTAMVERSSLTSIWCQI